MTAKEFATKYNGKMVVCSPLLLEDKPSYKDVVLGRCMGYLDDVVLIYPTIQATNTTHFKTFNHYESKPYVFLSPRTEEQKVFYHFKASSIVATDKNVEENMSTEKNTKLPNTIKMKVDDLIKFPHATMTTSRNGSAEIYCTGLNTFEVVFERMSFNHTKYHGHIKYTRNSSGTKPADKSSFLLYRNDNNEDGGEKDKRRGIEVITENAISFCSLYPHLFIEANKIAKKSEVRRLKDKLDLALEKNQGNSFDTIERRLFELKALPDSEPLVVLTDQEIGL